MTDDDFERLFADVMAAAVPLLASGSPFWATCWAVCAKRA